MIENIESLKNSLNNSVENWKNTIDSFPLETNLLNPSIPVELTTKSKEELKEILSDELKDLKLNSEELSFATQEIFDNTNRMLQELSDKLKEKTPDFDVKAILINAGTSAGIGGALGTSIGGVGALPGAVIGGISGASGEITKQVALHNGASESMATGIQITTEVLSGTGLVKFAGSTVAKNLISSSDEVSIGIKNSKVGEAIFEKIDDVSLFTKDKLKALEFDIKGLVNDSKTHTFIDNNGNKFLAKIEEIIDMKRTITMPYLGSNLDNTNAAGFLRDSSKFAKEYLKEFPETLSTNNKLRAALGKAPLVDKQWITFNPNHETFLGQTLHHHHINNTGIVGYLPEKLHNGSINKSAVHVDEMVFSDELISLIKNKLARS